jgi:predicted DNA-binding transcriptional regulator YafY
LATKRADADRRARQGERLARLLKVLQLVQGLARCNTRNMARELGCCERTIYRDIQVLQVAGIPCWFDQEEQSYRVRPDFRFPALSLTDEEVLGHAVATAVASAPGLAIGPRPTTRKLAAASRETTRRLLADAERLNVALDLKLADHSRHQPTIRTIQEALLQRRQLVGRYRSPYQKTDVSLRLNPYRLCLVQQAWYLIAQPDSRPRPQTYRVARFTALRTDEQLALAPVDFDLRAYFGDAWGVFRGKTSYEVEITFTPDAAPLVTETTWHHTQQSRRHEDGSVTQTFRVDGLSEILWWVLGWAGRAAVVRPPELRTMVVEQLRAALALHDEPAAPANEDITPPILRPRR